AILVGVPVVALLFAALGAGFAAVPVLVLVLLAAPAMPLLEVLPARVAVRAAGVVAALAVLTVLGAAVTSPVDVRHPLPPSLVSALDADTGQARWLSADPAPNDWTAGFVHGDRTPMERDFPPLTGALLSSYLSGPAPVAALPAPEVSVVDSQ